MLTKSNNITSNSYESNIEFALETEIFMNRELEKSHGKYIDELRFHNLVKNGEVDKLKIALKLQTTKTIGRMSKNPLRQQMYLFVARTTLTTRFAIEGGLCEEDAYYLSDIYIQKADACVSSDAIWNLAETMILDFTHKVQLARQSPAVSTQIESIVDYIFNHLHTKITLDELASHAGFTPTYLSYLFKKETGLTLTEFMQKKRVTEAQNLLRYSDYSIAEISQYLCFCSQSHFTSIFKNYTNMTPAQYRKAN
ncbi:MAG: AraC family transcriptional regulator [Lachnotalea sp.]